VATQKFNLRVLELVRHCRTLKADAMTAPVPVRDVESVLLNPELDAEGMLSAVVEKILGVPF
jgi:hypothetical protein